MPFHAPVCRALRQTWEFEIPTEPNGYCATSSAGSTRRRLASLPASSKGSMRFWLSRASNCRRRCGACSPAQRNREHDGNRARRLSQYEAMAKCRDGAVLDGHQYDGSGPRLPSSLQPTPGTQGCACRSCERAHRHEEYWTANKCRIATAMSASSNSTKTGASQGR
jgi:hypothetical protein